MISVRRSDLEDVARDISTSLELLSAASCDADSHFKAAVVNLKRAELAIRLQLRRSAMTKMIKTSTPKGKHRKVEKGLAPPIPTRRTRRSVEANLQSATKQLQPQRSQNDSLLAPDVPPFFSQQDEAVILDDPKLDRFLKIFERNIPSAETPQPTNLRISTTLAKKLPLPTNESKATRYWCTVWLPKSIKGVRLSLPITKTAIVFESNHQIRDVIGQLCKKCKSMQKSQRIEGSSPVEEEDLWENADQFALRVAGREDYLFCDTEIFKSRYVRESLRHKEHIEFVMMEVSTSIASKDRSDSTNPLKIFSIEPKVTPPPLSPPAPPKRVPNRNLKKKSPPRLKLSPLPNRTIQTLEKNTDTESFVGRSRSKTVAVPPRPPRKERKRGPGLKISIKTNQAGGNNQSRRHSSPTSKPTQMTRITNLIKKIESNARNKDPRGASSPVNIRNSASNTKQEVDSSVFGENSSRSRSKERNTNSRTKTKGKKTGSPLKLHRSSSKVQKLIRRMSDQKSRSVSPKKVRPPSKTSKPKATNPPSKRPYKYSSITDSFTFEKNPQKSHDRILRPKQQTPTPTKQSQPHLHAVVYARPRKDSPRPNGVLGAMEGMVSAQSRPSSTPVNSSGPSNSSKSGTIAPPPPRRNKSPRSTPFGMWR